MTDAQLAAAESMRRALFNMPCACTHNVPYAGGQVEQVVVRACARCRALTQWTIANKPGGAQPAFNNTKNEAKTNNATDERG